MKLKLGSLIDVIINQLKIMTAAFAIVHLKPSINSLVSIENNVT